MYFSLIFYFLFYSLSCILFFPHFLNLLKLLHLSPSSQFFCPFARSQSITHLPLAHFRAQILLYNLYITERLFQPSHLLFSIQADTETRNLCAPSVPVYQIKRQHISEESNLQHLSFRSDKANVSYYEAPKIGMKYHHNTALFHDRLSPGFDLQAFLPERQSVLT